MSTKYIVMFTAGGRAGGAKIGAAELAAMHKYIEEFRAKYPAARIYEHLGMATVELDTTTELDNDPNIYYVHPVKLYQLNSTIQANAPWHLTNISDSLYDSYEYTTSGNGVTTYVVDTGIAWAHPEFEGRASRGFFIGTPTHMHGTHVAGIIGSKTYGVAKKSQLVSVQVFDPSKDVTAGAERLLDGLNWILSVHPQGQPGVVNMSLGSEATPADQPGTDAIQALIAEGLLVVVAAGNTAVDVGGVWPAQLPDVITVGAITSGKLMASFSNFGAGVDIFAPGVDITSTTLNNTTDTISGTSMAAPVVSGICARYLELCPDTTQADMQARLLAYAKNDCTTKASTTKKRVMAKIPGIRNSTTGRLSQALSGQYRVFDGSSYGPDIPYGVFKRIATVQRLGLDSSMLLATEVSKVTLPDTPAPVVTPPVVLPPPISYDGGTAVFSLDWTVTFKGSVYAPTSGTYEYKYPGIIDLTVALLPGNAFEITTVSQLPALPEPINYDGGTLVFNSDKSVSFKGVKYTETSPGIYDYPGTLYIEIAGTVVTVSQQAPPVRPPAYPLAQLDPVDTSSGVWGDRMTVELYPNPPVITKTAPIRVIAIDVADPNQLSAYGLNLQFSSGTFNFSGIGFTLPANKTALTVQGHNGIVERVAENAAVGSAPLTVEGRLLPIFSNEMVYINKYRQINGTPWETRDIVAEIAAQAGAAVTFNGTNNKVKEFEFTGRFTQALEQLADLSCGRLLQQNGNWMIVPKHTNVGDFTVHATDIISWQSEVQSDVLDMIASLMGSLKDAILDRDLAYRLIARIKNKLENITELEDLPDDPDVEDVTAVKAWEPFCDINFSFGFNGKLPLVQMNEGLLIDGFEPNEPWEYWPEGEQKSNIGQYWKVEPASDGRMRGLKNLDLATIYYPVNPPTNAAQYRATGTLRNLTCTLWAGTEHIAASMQLVSMAKQVTAVGEVETPEKQLAHYFAFTRRTANNFAGTESKDDKQFYSAQMKVEYLPAESLPWKFIVTVNKDYRLISGLNYLIPIAGGAILNKNGASVAQFDRTSRTITLQDGTIVATVLCRDDEASEAVTDPETGETTWTDIVKGDPYQCLAPAPTPGGTTIQFVGAIDDLSYVLRTKEGLLFGVIHSETGTITDVEGNYVGTYRNSNTVNNVLDAPLLWESKGLGYVYSGTYLVGVLNNQTDETSEGYIGFTNAVAYPDVESDPNYASLLTTLLNNELAAAKVDALIAEAKIACIQKELTHYGVDYSGMLTACAAWKKYNDAVELRDYPPITVLPAAPPVPETDDVIQSYEVAAVAATGAAMAAVNASKPREKSISVTYLYDNRLPLAGMHLTLEPIAGTGITVDGGIIETVAFNGQTVSISAKQGYSI